jgi:hypothetical protein
MKKSKRRKPLTPEERRWKKQFAALAKYKREHGHCFVLPKQDGNTRLAKWSAEQRAMWRSGEILSERFHSLNQLGFAWDYRKGLWDRRFIELQAFQRKHGHCQVSSCSKKYSNLGNWVHFQRVQKRAGRLSRNRVRRLNQIGFDWISRGRSVEYRNSADWDAKWERMLSSLIKFKNRYGHCWVPSGRPGNPALSRWVSRQRKLKRYGRLKKDRQRRLQALGFGWKSAATANLRWERCFQRLLEFYRRFGNSHVPAEWAENRAMASWVVKTRMLRRKGRLSADKVRRLNTIGFVWNATRKRRMEHDVIWTRRLDQLVAFHRKHGHWCVPTDQRRYHSLRIWMDNQRIKYQRGRMSADRIRRLEKVHFPWLSDRGQRMASEG